MRSFFYDQNKLKKYIYFSNLVVLFYTTGLGAVTYSWNVPPPSPGDWTIGANWTPAGGPPITGDVANINNGGEAQLSLGSVGQATTLNVGGLLQSRLLIQTGADLTIAGNAFIGGSGRIGTATLKDTGSSLVVGGTMSVGGTNSQGYLEVINGASMQLGNLTFIGSPTSGTAELKVSDPGTLMTGIDFLLSNQGVFNLLNGAHAQTDRVIVGTQGVTTANFSGSGTFLSTRVLTAGASGGAQGTITIEDGAEAEIQSGGLGVIVGVLSPSTGTINLNGTDGSRGRITTNLLQGGSGSHTVNFDGGILRANIDNATFVAGFDSNDLNVLSGGLFIDSQAFNIATTNDFSGPGEITKLGSGRLTFYGNNTNNGVNVIEGTLAVDGSQSGLVSISNGATLTGAGTVGAINNSGFVSPGNGIGTLTVLANHVNTPSGTHVNELNAAGQTDLLTVGGTSIIQGGTLEIDAAPGNYLAGTSYTLITAAGGLSGQFTTVIDNLPINYLLFYFPNSLVLRLGDAINLDGLTGNARRVAEYINGFSSTSLTTGDFFDVLLALESLNSNDLENALDQLHPAPFQALTITAGDSAHMVNDSFMDRLNFLRTTRCGQCCDPCDLGGVWISGLANYVDQSRSQGLRGFDATNGGFAIGYDQCICDNIIAGIASGYSNNYIKWNRHYGHSDGQNAYLGIYATQFDEDYYIDASLLGFKGTYKSKRHIEFADIDRRAKSKQCNWGINPHFGSGLILDYCGFDVIPFGEIDYYYVTQDKFHEHGANSLNLHVKSHDASFLRLETGVRFAKAYDCCGYGQFLPYASISYVGHRYYGRKFKSSFNDQPNDFSVFGTDRCFNQAEFGLGFAYLINDQFAINASYDIDVGSKRQQQEFNFELSYRF